MSLHSSAEGVCVKCFSKVEKIIKYRREIAAMVSQFEESMRKFKLKATPGSSTRKKRALRSDTRGKFLFILVKKKEIAHWSCLNNSML